VIVKQMRQSLVGGAAAVRGISQLEDGGDRGVVGSGPATAATTAAQLRALAELLLPKSVRRLLPTGGEVVVIPQGPLASVPWSALPLGDSTFGSRYALRYAPSLAMLATVERSAPSLTGSEIRDSRRSALIVANPSMPMVKIADGRRVRLPRLAGADAEGRWLAAKLGVTDWLTASAATDASVRQRLPDATIAHFATHGYAFGEEGRERESFIALAPSAGHDGLLTVAEVLDQMPALRTELLVLSACQTALGTDFMSEGTVGIQRAFFAKGVRSMLVSLWNVSDAATALLMRRFYTHLLDDSDGPSKAEALRRAQADVRSDPRYRAPRYWAAFQLVGAH
jgi:CHAT domain-containing protein